MTSKKPLKPCVQKLNMEILLGYFSFTSFLVLKLLSANFYKIFIIHQMIALQKLRKMFFILSKKLFCPWDIQIFVFRSSPLFLPVSHCFRAWSTVNFKVHDVINCQNKNLITHLVWHLEREKGITLKLCPLTEY